MAQRASNPTAGPDGLVRSSTHAMPAARGVLTTWCSTISAHRATTCRDCPYLSSASNPWGRYQYRRRRPDEVRHYITTARCDGCATSTPTACGWTPCMHWVDTAVHVLEELANATRWLLRPVGPSAVADRRNRPKRPSGRSPAQPWRYGITAQWNDGIHHAIHTAVSGERQGYLCGFRLAGHSRTRCATVTPTPARIRRSASSVGRALTLSAIPGHQAARPHSAPTHRRQPRFGDRPSQYLTGGQLAIKAA